MQICYNPQLGLEWIRDFAAKQQSQTQSWRVRTSLRDYQAAYELHHPGRCFVEALDRTDFFRSWLNQGEHTEQQLRNWHTSMRGFARWLFESQLINHNVMTYVFRRDVLAREVPLLRLERGLQREISRFEESYRARCERYTGAAHRWNLYRNRPECLKWPCPEAEEECWRAWLAQLALGPEGLIWKRDLVRGLERFFDFLVKEGRLEANHFSNFLRLRPARATLVEGSGNLEPFLKAPKTAPPLPEWMKNYQAHLESRGHRAGTGSATLSNLRVLNRVMERQSLDRPEEITADTVQAYLAVYEGQGPGQTSSSTRRLRLITLRGLVRFLTRRGIQAPLRMVEAWPRARKAPFRPHIYSLNELSRILSRLRAKAEHSPVPLTWLGLEAIVFLLYACGLRAGEALRLRLGHVDQERRLLLIAKTKFYKERWVPLGSGAALRLSEFLRLRERAFPTLGGADHFVFLSSRGNALSSSVLRLEYRRTVDSLAIGTRGSEPPRAHDLRHSMAVHRLYKWYSEGADVQNKLPLLAAYLGHTHYHNTQEYLHLAEDLIRQAGRNFQQAFEQVVGEVAREAPAT